MIRSCPINWTMEYLLFLFSAPGLTVIGYNVGMIGFAKIARYKTTLLLLGAYIVLVVACLVWALADSGFSSGLEVAGLAAALGVPLYMAIVYFAYGLILFVIGLFQKVKPSFGQIMHPLLYTFLLLSAAMAAIIVAFTALNVFGFRLSQDTFIRLTVILHVTYIVGSFYMPRQVSEPQ